MNLLDRLYVKRWGFTLVGARCKLRFLVNRFLRFLSKPWSNVYYGWDWFEKPFSLKSCIFRTSDGFMFRMYDIDITLLIKHEPYFQKALQSTLSRGSVFIDVGAHGGGFTVRASKIVGDEGLVVAFEPDFRNYYYLIQNIMLNRCRNVIALPLAAYSATGSVLGFNISKCAGHSSITDMHMGEVVSKTYVYTVTIDDVVKTLALKRVDAIKIDVEEAEVEVLKGAKETLRKYKPALLVEVHGVEQWRALGEMLQEEGYAIKVLHVSPIYEWHKHVLALPKR